MNGISVVIAQVFGRWTCQRKYSCNGELSPMMSQVTNRAHNTTRLENTGWNFSFREANDIISEPGINSQSRRAAERWPSAVARDQHSS
jgi:hypothetical protein